MIVLLTDAAESDLEDIGDWIARDNPVRAVSFVNELRSTCFDLAGNPHCFQRVPHDGSAEIRRRVFRKYVVIYDAEPERVTILRILHGARDYGAILFPA